MKSRPADINPGLKFIRISCNIIDTQNNIFMDANSNTLLSLAITNTQSLKRSGQHYLILKVKYRINKGVIDQVSFKVINIGSILLDLYIV